MTTTVPPPAPPDLDGERDVDALIDELEALIEEARRRARRRRRVYAAAVVAAIVAGAAATFDRGGDSGVSLGRSEAEASPGSIGTQVGAGRWGPSLGPEGGAVFALAIDPIDSSTVYAGGWGNVFKSTNGGARWKDVTSEPWTRVTALAIAPTRQTTVYVATDRGIARTTNGGRTWRQASRGLFDGETSGQRLHRLAEGFVYGGLAVDLARPEVVYAGTSRGLFRTTDGGGHWRRISSRPSICCGSFALDPHSPGTLYSTAYGPGASEIHRSTDRGESWQRVGSVLGNDRLGSLVVDPHVRGTLYAADAFQPGVLKSTDAGATWRVVGLPRQTVSSLFADRSTRETVYAITAAGAFKSSDGGLTWRRLDAGSNRLRFGSIATDPRDPDTMYGAAENGVIKSADGGRTWGSSSAGLISTDIAGLELAPRSSTVLYASTWSGVHVSVDGGRRWAPPGVGLPRGGYALAVDPRRADTAYVGTWGFGVFKTTDGGGHWRSVNTGLTAEIVDALAIDPLRPDTLYAGTRGDGVFKTVNGGTRWRRTSPPRQVSDLAIDPQDPSTVYAGTAFGLLRSLDGGGSWAFVARAPGEQGAARVGYPATIEEVAIDPRDPSVIYAGTRVDGVLKTTDGGATWRPMNVGLPRSRSVDALMVDPRRHGTVYAAGDAGVFRSTDRAANWRRFGSGLTGPGIRNLAITSDGRILYGGTGGAGVVALRLDR